MVRCYGLVIVVITINVGIIYIRIIMAAGAYCGILRQYLIGYGIIPLW